MRGCLIGALLLILLVGNGYALFEIHRLQGEVARLSSRVEGARVLAPETASLPDLVNTALDALRRGDPETAGLALDRFSKRVRDMQDLADARRQQLEKTAAKAKQAVEGKGKEAEAALRRLLQEVSPSPGPRKPPQK